MGLPAAGMGESGWCGVAVAGGGASKGEEEEAMELKKWNVTVVRFDPAQGVGSGERFVLPVDSPDAEHGVSAAMSNAIAWTPKVDGGSVRPVAFACLGVAERE